MQPRVNVIAAVGENRVIGKGNGLLWHLPDDLKRFKQLTLGHPCIMGRKTFDSILRTLGKPLPGRANIVVTRDSSWQHEGVEVAHSLEEALDKARALDQEIFIIGGGEIYQQALSLADRLYLTLVSDSQEGDTYFPAYEQLFTKVLNEEAREQNGITFIWKDLEK